MQEIAAVEISDRFPAAHFDVIASTLALSEMSEEEQAYVLASAWRFLRPGGRLVIAVRCDRLDDLLALAMPACAGRSVS